MSVVLDHAVAVGPREPSSDPTQSFYSPIIDTSVAIDKHMLHVLGRQSQNRREVNGDVIAIREHMSGFADTIKAFESGDVDEAEVLEQYRTTASELEEVWKRYNEKYGYLGNPKDAFITNSSEVENVTKDSIQKCMEKCGAIAKTLENIEVPELDMLLTQALEFNILAMRALMKTAEHASEGTGRTATRNMGK